MLFEQFGSLYQIGGIVDWLEGRANICKGPQLSGETD